MIIRVNMDSKVLYEIIVSWVIYIYTHIFLAP